AARPVADAHGALGRTTGRAGGRGDDRHRGASAGRGGIVGAHARRSTDDRRRIGRGSAGDTPPRLRPGGDRALLGVTKGPPGGTYARGPRRNSAASGL